MFCYFVSLCPSFSRCFLIAEIPLLLLFFVLFFHYLQQKSHSHSYYMYCPLQELVNLLITGKAVSNTFDNIMEVDTGGSKKVWYLRRYHERYFSWWLMCLKGFVIVCLTIVTINRDFSAAYCWSSSGDSVEFLSETVCTPVVVNDCCIVDPRFTDTPVIRTLSTPPSVSLFKEFDRITNRRRFSYVTVLLFLGKKSPLLFLLIRPA